MPKVFGKSDTRDLFCDEIVRQGWPNIFDSRRTGYGAVDAGLKRCPSFRGGVGEGELRTSGSPKTIRREAGKGRTKAAKEYRWEIT